jgi:hypothetical protein
MQLLEMEKAVNLLRDEITAIEVANKNMDSEKLLHLEEIKLLKDYVYGIDQRARDVHYHKFGGKAN